MKRTVSGAPDVQSSMNLGQIEQVVSSADCRQVEPQDSQNGGHQALQANIRDGETAGTSRLDANQPSLPEPVGLPKNFCLLCGEVVRGRARDHLCSGSGYSASERLPFDDPPLEHAPQISLEERLFVALCARGEQSFVQFLFLALDNAKLFDRPFTSDSEFVEAVEDFVFGLKRQ